MEGTVKFFNQKKGYGFVSGDDEKDYFIHFSALTPGVFLRQDDRISFDANDSDRGLKAEKVVLLQKGSEIRANSEEAPVEETSEEPKAEEPATEEAPAQEETPAEEPAAEEEPKAE